MLIDFDGLTIIIGIVIYILICIFIHKKYKKEKIYYVFSTIMFWSGNRDNTVSRNIFDKRLFV